MRFVLYVHKYNNIINSVIRQWKDTYYDKYVKQNNF